MTHKKIRKANKQILSYRILDVLYTDTALPNTMNNEEYSGVHFTKGLGVKLSPKIGYFVPNFGGSFTPKLFCETYQYYCNYTHLVHFRLLQAIASARLSS